MLLLNSCKKVVFFFFIIFTLLGCGFSYNYSGITKVSSMVYIDYMQGTYGNILRNRLSNYFNSEVKEDTRYVLRANTSVDIEDSNTDSDGFATSKLVRITVKWNLYDIEADEVIINETASSFTRYSIRDLNYINNQDELSSIDASIVVIAKKISDTIAVKLGNKEQ